MQRRRWNRAHRAMKARLFGGLLSASIPFGHLRSAVKDAYFYCGAAFAKLDGIATPWTIDTMRWSNLTAVLVPLAVLARGAVLSERSTSQKPVSRPAHGSQGGHRLQVADSAKGMMGIATGCCLF